MEENILGEEVAAPVEELVKEELAEGEEVEAPEETTEEEAEPKTEPVEKHVPLKALEDERRKRQEMERKLQELESRVPPKPETLQDRYLKNPTEVTAYINSEIKRLAADDPYANAGDIEELRDLKIELKNSGQAHLQQMTSTFVTKLHEAVPDFTKKKDALTQYAVDEMEYTMEELAELSNPLKVGAPAAIKFIKQISKQYEKSQAGKTVTQKTTPKVPTSVETPGAGAPPAKPDKDLKAIRAKAEATGNWSEYYRRIGLAT